MRKDEMSQMDNSPMKYKGEFEAVYGIIAAHRERVVRVVNNQSMLMVWEVGGYVSSKLRSSAWGDGVVRMLAEYIHTKNPKAKGWSYRTIYKMVQLYETYSTDSFNGYRLLEIYEQAISECWRKINFSGLETPY